MANFSVIVPVLNETDALQFSSDYFKSFGIRPIYALDSKRSARRAEVERLVQDDVTIFQNSGNCIEAGYEALAALSTTDWILRIDCDEIPNLAALRHCGDFVNNPSDIYCGFDRDT